MGHPRIVASLFDGDFLGCVGGEWGGSGAGENDRGDREEDDDHAEDFRWGEALVEEDDAEQDGDHRVDEGVGGDLGHGDVLEQVDVRGEADYGAEDSEIKDAQGSDNGPLGGLEVACGNGDGEVDDAGGADLPGGGGEGVNLEAEAA